MVTAAGRVWWLTRGLPGRAPGPRSLDDTLAVASGLATLHTFLRQVPRNLAVMRTDSLALFGEGVRLAARPLRIGLRPADLAVIDAAAAIVRTHWNRLSARPRQLVHGDPSYPNLRLSLGSPPRLTGILDWESCRYDLPLADLSRLGQAVLYRSGTADAAAGLTQALQRYSGAPARGGELTDLLVAMIMAKFESIAHHGRRYLDGEGPRDLVASQPGKIARILALFETTVRAGTR
jgi:macrolide phosphotransferase